MALETILVRRKTTGDTCLINAADFDAAEHTRVDKSQPETVVQSFISDVAAVADQLPGAPPKPSPKKKH